MKKVLSGLLVFTLVMSFSMAYATPLVYTNFRPVTIGSTSDLASACQPGHTDCQLQTLLPMFNVNTDQQVAGYWQLGGINPGTLPTVAFEITANAANFQTGIFSVNGGDTGSPKTLVDIFLGPAGANTKAAVTFDGAGNMTIVKVGGVTGSVNEGTFTGINVSGFGFYEQPTGDAGVTFYSLDQLNPGGIAQVLAFRELPDNRWTIAFEDTARPGGDFDYNDFIFQIESITPVPEPATLLLLGLGLLGVAGIRRKFKSSKS